MVKRETSGRNMSMNTPKLVEDTLRIYKNAKARKGVNLDRFVNEVLNKDGLGKERVAVYKANDFLDSAFAFYKGKLKEEQYQDLFDCLVGYEFNAILYRQLSKLGASEVTLEDPVAVKKNKTAADAVAKFDTDIAVHDFTQVQKDMTEVPFEISAGKDAFEAKAREKVSNSDISSQLKLLADSKKYDNCYGIILEDTSVSRDVVREIYRVGAVLARANNIRKSDIIKKVLNIYG